MPNDDDSIDSLERVVCSYDGMEDLEPSEQPNVHAKNLLSPAGRLLANVPGSGGNIDHWARHATCQLSDLLGATLPEDRRDAARAEVRQFGIEGAAVLAALRLANDAAIRTIDQALRVDASLLPRHVHERVRHEWQSPSDWTAPGSSMQRWLLWRIAGLIDTGVFDSTPDRAIATRSGAQTDSSEEDEGEEEDTSDESESEGEDESEGEASSGSDEPDDEPDDEADEPESDEEGATGSPAKRARR